MSKSLPVTTINRRTVFAGAGAIGAVGALAAVTGLPGPAKSPVQAAEVQPEQGGGYQLTEHVKQYYATARI
jgi:hypothetical protein